MKRFVIAGHHFPMSMMLMFRRAFQRIGYEVIKIGPEHGKNIPWPGRPTFPQYVDAPDIGLTPGIRSFSLAALKNRLPEIDGVFNFDAGFRLLGKLEGVPSILYGTDPHALDYRQYLHEYDAFFSAQNRLMRGDLPEGSLWIPLAYDEDLHRALIPVEASSRPVDVCFVGVMGEGDNERNPYRKRWKAVSELSHKVNTFATTGLIFKEYEEAYNRAKVSFNWSSSTWDLPMRIWEGAAMGCCVVTNRMPHLEELGFVDGDTCVIFDSHEEMLDKVQDVLNSGAWKAIAKRGQESVRAQTYTNRVRAMLDHLGLG